jgi:DNA-binding NtrC family response regulator
MVQILIVDDEKKIREIYSNLLKSDGYETMEASNASDAYEIVKKGGIDLVLLDINMPDIDGSIVYELIDTFRIHTKVIVCSVLSLSEQKHVIKGALDYYDKSEGLEALQSKVSKFFKGSNK